MLDPDIIFLNHGSYGATPVPVFEEYRDWQIKLERQPVLFLGRELQNYLKHARECLGKYLNADPDDLVYVPNATFGVNIVARSLNLTPDDEILMTNHEYGACENTWWFICEKTRSRLRRQQITLPVNDEQEIMEQLWQGVTDRTRLIFVSHVSSPTAITFPVERICARARQCGILTFVDGAHAPGQINVDLQAIGADFYVGNCHKWMLAPKGAGFIHVRRENQTLIEPIIVSWGWPAAAEHSTGSPFLDYLQNWGTRDHAASLSVPAAIHFLGDYKWEEIQRSCHAMLAGVIEAMGELTGLEKVYSRSSFYQQMAALTLPEQVDVVHMKEHLYNKNRIEIPCYRWEERPIMRLSVQGYNTQQELQYLLSAVEQYLKQAA